MSVIVHPLGDCVGVSDAPARPWLPKFIGDSDWSLALKHLRGSSDFDHRSLCVKRTQSIDARSQSYGKQHWQCNLTCAQLRKKENPVSQWQASSGNVFRERHITFSRNPILLPWRRRSCETLAPPPGTTSIWLSSISRPGIIPSPVLDASYRWRLPVQTSKRLVAI